MVEIEVLNLRDQNLREEDLLECLAVNSGHLGDELVGHAQAIEIWKSLIRSPAFTSAVIVNDKGRADRRIVAFGASVFAQSGFVNDELSNPRPYLNARLMAAIMAGKSVVLSEAEIRRANAEGRLDSLILYGSWRFDVLGPEGVHEVCARLGFSYVEKHRGYNLNRLVKESVGEEERSSFEAALVWQVVRQFDEPGHQSRSLWVITRERGLAVKANIINPLFIHKAPVLGLRDADQRLLVAAAEGLTDEELSSSLGLSLTGVKKRWTSIFGRTIEARPDLFPLAGGKGKVGDKRGRQKRHHVLAYVRAHPEELRPFEGVG